MSPLVLGHPITKSFTTSACLDRPPSSLSQYGLFLDVLFHLSMTPGVRHPELVLRLLQSP
jgi:hypothetical protein